MELDFTRLPLAIKLAVASYLLSLGVWVLWPQLQGLAAYLPAGTQGLSEQATFWCIMVSMTLMIQHVAPPYNRWRILANLVGIFAFLINLLYEKNSGNVSLQVSLFIITGWSVWANRHHHLPVRAARRDWVRVLVIIAVSYAACRLALALWPVQSGTEYPGWYWPYVGLLASLILTVAIVSLETRVIPGSHWLYAAITGAGSVLLVISYLGEFNAAGLQLNTALAVAIYGPRLIGYPRPLLQGTKNH